LLKEPLKVVGLDTNVLVRYIVEDDTEQASLARQLIEGKCTAAKPAHITLLVLCELIWVLGRSYNCTKQQLSTVLENILLTECFDIEHHDLAWAAFHDYDRTNVDFADCLISRLNQAKGSSTTFTFDKKAANLDLYTLLQENAI
jgi:predicted nucleic-acid-binding protein